MLSGNADILSADEAKLFEALLSGGEVETAFLNDMVEKGYWVDETAEKQLYRTKYFDFVDERDTDEVQLFFVPNYACNFACSYCYQDEYISEKQQLTDDVIEAFFNYINSEFAGRKRYLTIFGGEPLLNSEKQKSTIAKMLSYANNANLEVCFVTNGYSLSSYIEILKKAKIREIQVTLDGLANMHNQRRFTKAGEATFEQIVNGIDACLSNQIPVNLRMVVDKENIHDLPGLAQFAINRGWTTDPNFKTQLGRNYELHHCQADNNRLFSRISLYQEVYQLIKEFPEILEFHKPAFSVSKFLAENGDLPDPLYDACPACKTEWAFDYTGSIYSCTATVGKAGESLGTFYPEVTKLTETVNKWESRDVTAIEQCRNCNLQLACGGGCGSVAKNQTGNICSPDCRPVKELLELGFATWFPEKGN